MNSKIAQSILLDTGELIVEDDISNALKLWEVLYPDYSIINKKEFYKEDDFDELYSMVSGYLRFRNQSNQPYTPKEISSLLKKIKY